MTGCRYKRRKMTVGSAADRSGLSTPSIEGLCVASRSMAPGLDLYTQAIKALTVSCPFDSSEVTPRLGTVPSVLAASLHKSDGRRKHRKFREDAAGKAVRPGRPPSAFSMWERTEAYFRPITVDDIDLLVTRLPPDNCFYIPSSGNVVENVTSDEAIPHERPLVDVDVGTSSVAGKEESECAQVEPSQDLKFNGEVTCTAALPLEELELDEKKSLNWILECKQRYLLTSGRLLKKKILFGEDAGLEQLLLLPRMEAASPCCDFCCSGGSDVKSNRLLLCDSCKVSVHQKCYGVHEVPARGWLCSWCKHLESAGRKNLRNSDDENSTSRPCMLCPKTSGALKPLAKTLEGSEETKFVHLFCCLWTPGMYVENAGNMEPISNFENLSETRRRLVCNLCKVKHGTCVRCSHGSCRASLHPVCARAANHQMEIWGKFGVDNVELRVFCSKHSPVQKIESVSKEEHASTIGDLDMVEKLLPENVIKKLPKIRITRKGKDNSVQDGKDISIFDGGMKNDSNLDNENLVIQCSSESGDAESMKMERALAVDNAVDNANVLQSTSDFSSIFRKIIDRRKISIADVALELGVSCASLESSVMEEGRTIPSELKSKIIQWLQNFVYVQPSTCHLKSRNASIILSNCIKSSFDDSSACLLDPNEQDVVMFPELAAPLFAKPPSVSLRMNSNDDLIDYNALTSSVEALLQKNTKQKCATLGGGLPSDCINVATSACDGVSFCNIDNEHHKELNNAEMSLGDNTCFVNSNDSKEQFYEDEDMPQGSYMKAISDYSHLNVENNQNSEANISELKTDNLGCSNYASNLGGYHNIEDIGPCSMPYIHPFILKKLREYQNLWSLLHKQRNIKTGCYGKWSTADTETVEGCLSDATRLDQLSKFKSMRAMIFSPTDEIEGELLYLQNCLLDRVNAIKYSCEELIHRMITHLPQEIDAFRKKSWDMVLVNKHLCEVKEAKKRGRKERRHKEAQAILAAATAAAASSRNSMLRKDAVDGISLTQQNPLKISTITRRPKETISRSSVAKISSDKYSGDFKFPNFAMENALFCDVCWRTETLVNRIFVCSNCKVAVHLDCYRRLKDPTGPWRCELCEDASLQSSPKNKQLNSGENSSYRSQCSLCSGVTGAFRKTTDGEWVHAFCAEWLLESTYKRGQQTVVGGMDAIPMEKDANACCICHYKLGLCLKCSYGHCQAKFHPTCARSAGFFMNIKAIGGRFQHKAYCEKHSVEQREKVDSQHGAEELKNVKLVRVDLEKVRLLCERIIRREKFKRDLVVCSHGILASRRDCVAFSAMVRSSFTPGISSESATTSIDNPSYSEAFQRCDDLMTVDSTAIIHGRRSSCRPPTDVDRKTDDSSTSQLLDKRKLADRAVFSGKHLPQRSADHKGVKTVLQKERAMMALYQASLQEDNSAACDSESC